MKHLKLAFGSTVTPNIFDGEDDEAAAAAAATAAAAAAAGGGGGGAFTQEQVNSMIAAEKRKLEDLNKKKNQDLLKQFELLQTTASLTKEEKSSLTKEIEDLRTKAFTAEELAAQEREKLNNKHKVDIDNVSSERDAWRERYSEAQVTRSITDAAVEHDAFNTQQIVALLKPATRLIEVKDEGGNLTGEFVPRVFKKTQKDGVQVELELTPQQAVEQLKEDKSFHNLFKGLSVDGTGSGNIGGSSGVSLKNIKNVADYKKNRDKILGR